MPDRFPKNNLFDLERVTQNGSKWLNYRLSDIFKGYCRKRKQLEYLADIQSTLPDSIAGQHIARTRQLEAKNQDSNFEILEQVLQDKFPDILPPAANEIVLHLRVGDIIVGFQNGDVSLRAPVWGITIAKLRDFLRRIEKMQGAASNILYGAHKDLANERANERGQNETGCLGELLSTEDEWLASICVLNLSKAQVDITSKRQDLYLESFSLGNSMSSKPGYILPPPHQDYYYHFFIDILAQLQRELFASNLSKGEFTLYYSGPFEKLLPYFCDDIRPRATAPEGTPVLPKKGGLFWRELREIRSVLTVGMPANEPKLITLVRRTTTRQLKNHAELYAVLQQFGAEVVDVDPAAMSFEDQIRLFSNSKLVVAAHGSALTNILFMQPGSSVIEINAYGYIWYEYQKMCKKLGLRHHFVECDADHDLAVPDDLVNYIGHRPPYFHGDIRALPVGRKRYELIRFVRDNSVMQVAPMEFEKLVAETICSQ